ncbi:hypothetical protein T12_16477 [Trichinella patagoniensis]|uniref:Uncharacterized protein n=1 Tax=Trichinella patagoniensis TaxID=990121 RepID=A0A0V1A5X1_9BILA|nr:hypothetical protein T12_16477 [Trichinella patagoniensis]
MKEVKIVKDKGKCVAFLQMNEQFAFNLWRGIFSVMGNNYIVVPQGSWVNGGSERLSTKQLCSVNQKQPYAASD